MAVPIIGPRVGPMLKKKSISHPLKTTKITYKIVMENTAIGIPLSSIAQISAMLPPTLHIGAEAAKPAI